MPQNLVYIGDHIVCRGEECVFRCRGQYCVSIIEVKVIGNVVQIIYHFTNFLLSRSFGC